MTRQGRLITVGVVMLVVTLAAAWIWFGRDRLIMPDTGTEASGVGRPSNPALAPGSSDVDPRATGKSVPVEETADTGAERAPVPTPDGPPLPFNPLSLPDWFDARVHFSHARLRATRDENDVPLGVRVISVHPGLRPARLQVEPGDLLLRINGVSLTDPAYFDRAEAIVGWTFLRADLVVVKIRREGEEFSMNELGPIDATVSEAP